MSIQKKRLKLMGGVALATAAILITASCGSKTTADPTTTVATPLSADTTTTVDSATTDGAPETTAAPTGPVGKSEGVGVTDTTIKLGIIVEDYPTDNTTPFFFRKDGNAAVKALVADINAKGGIAGRQIELVTYDFSVITDSHEACLKLVNQEKVFAIISGYATTASNDCFMKDGKTPVIDVNALTDAGNASYAGYHMTPSPTFDRSAKDWVYGANDLGMFDPAKGFKKLGVVSTSCEASIWDDPAKGIKHWLETVGVTSDKISEFRADCALESLLAAHEQALLKHSQDGVNVTMIAAQPVDRNYTALAHKQGFKTQYIWGDFHYATQSANAQSLMQDEVDGSYGITAFRQDILAPAAKACDAVVQAAGLPAFTVIQTDLLVMNYCTDLNIFKAVVEKAAASGTLSQASFVAAAPTVGKIASAVELSVDFTGDTSGGEEFIVVKWSKATTAWIQEGDVKKSFYS
ncbi:MAG: ABC transporter substrate-binding protein [Actinobacteria bacterium]|uniref:Unannotated protein n=1 Tax=freshwater metagenome TaxID=449393 RepID=A0A6J7MCW0_9ZZZZ|nr:ABC transporter substrate-binding protein [Actinomycetota bacterium]